MRDRMLRKDYWDDEKVGSLSIQAKAIFPLMWNIADDFGILEYCPTTIARKIVLSMDEVLKAISELTIKGFIIDYQKPKGKRLLIISNFLIHQVVNRPSPSKELTPEEFVSIQKKHNPNHVKHVIDGVRLKNVSDSMILALNSVKTEDNSVLNEMKLNEMKLNEVKLTTVYEIPLEFQENVKRVRDYISKHKMNTDYPKKSLPTDREIVELLGKCDCMKVMDWFDKLFIYFAGTPNKPKSKINSQYATILNWMKRDEKNPKGKTNVYHDDEMDYSIKGNTI